jgi:hypothetical protein
MMLKNASGLVWTDPRRLMFSEIRMGVHMAVVTSDVNRVGQRDVYVPPDEPDMAHRSYLSPDGKWVLLVEMDIDHLWEPCRLVPADGSSSGHKVGPPGGACTYAAWSPDGRWMYFTSNAVDTNHIWRQRFPDGKPEQITAGPTEEEGIAMAPDVAETTQIERPPRGREEVPVQLSRLLDAHQVIIRQVRTLARRASEVGDDGTNDLVVSEVLRTNELQAWFLSEHLVNVPLVEAKEPPATAGAA